MDIAFSNGFALANLPYYNGYYVNVGDPLLVGYPGSSYLKVCLNYGEDLWITAGFSEGDTATITLAQAGAYRDVQEAPDISYTDVRADYPSDEAFANFRALTGGNLKDDVAYRAASPIDNKHARASYVDTLMGDAGVQFVLDLSDNAEKVERYMAENRTAGIETPHFVDLYEKGQVALLNLGVNYHDDKFREALVAGLISLSEHDGPYLVHCLEGKDRTGFVCALLEALAGATYQEIVDDYMITYANYYGTTRDGEPQKYEAIKNLNIDGMLYYVAGVDDGTNLQDVDLAQGARTYLLASGMTDAQVDALVARLVG